MKFLDVKTDYAFKKVFGSADSGPVLISFLNAILDYKDEQKIIDLDILDPYMVPRLEGMKDTFVDVKAKLMNGKNIIIEMQVLNVKGLESRILFNAAKQYSQQLIKGDNYSLLNPVIALTFTDFNLFKQAERPISQFKLIETSQFIAYNDDVELIFVELPKFTKTLNELDGIKDKWIYFLQNAGKLDCIPETLNEPCIHQAFDVVNEAGLSREELDLQDKRRDFIIVQKSAIIDAAEMGMEKGLEEGLEKGLEKGLKKGRKEGLKKGRKEGLEEGLEKGLFDSALTMVNDFGLSPEEVAAKLHISLDKLREKLDR